MASVQGSVRWRSSLLHGLQAVSEWERSIGHVMISGVQCAATPASDPPEAHPELGFCGRETTETDVDDLVDYSVCYDRNQRRAARVWEC